MKSKKTQKRVQTFSGISGYFDGKASSVIPLASIASIIVATALKVKPLTPFIISSAIAPYVIKRLRGKDPGGALRYMLNWALTTFIFCATISVFLPTRAEKSFPYAGRSMAAFSNWITNPGDGCPYGLRMALLGIAAVFIASLISGGIGGLIILAGSLCSAAFAFAFIARHSDNLIHIALIGLPPWEIATFLAALFLIIPAASLFLRKFSSTCHASNSNQDTYIYFWIGLSLLAFAVITNLTLSNVWSELIGNCTIL